jgi:hypothetical protein
MSAPQDDGTSEDASTRESKTSTIEDATHVVKLERKTLAKLDLLLVSSMSALYLVAFLDRTNIGNARVAGLQADLGISDHQYSTGKYKLLARNSTRC